MTTEINKRTVGSLLAYCDWLREKNYQSANGVEAWKTAIKKVFETVEGEGYESLSLDGLDLKEYEERFRVASGSQYKAETIGVYGRRIRNAMDAQAEYISTGKQAMLSRGARTARADNGEAKRTPARVAPASPAATPESKRPTADLIPFPFPLAGGVMAELNIPPRLGKEDVDRLSAFLRTLQYEEQKQIPRRSGEEPLAA